MLWIDPEQAQFILIRTRIPGLLRQITQIYTKQSLAVPPSESSRGLKVSNLVVGLWRGAFAGGSTSLRSI
jgi:hypothetical protein